MRNSEKLAFKALQSWFERSARTLPWRENPTPYRVWVSEIMLQQTQVSTVIPYFDRWMRSFPTVKALADAEEAQVLEHWAGLGYYSRARNLHQGAKRLAAGRMPESREEWLEVPGVGPYTAGAICSIALQKPEAIVDGNVERVLARVCCLSRLISQRNPSLSRQKKAQESSYSATLWSLAESWVKAAFELKVKPRVFNQALMELGATLCRPREPLCALCPLAEICQAKKRTQQELFPEPKPKPELIKVQEDCSLVIRREKTSKKSSDEDLFLLLTQAPEGAWRAGLWDLPHDAWLGVNGEPSERGGDARLVINYAVTRHRIRRTTRVVHNSELPPSIQRKIEQELKKNPSRVRWVRWRASDLLPEDVALGAPVRKVLKNFRDGWTIESGHEN
jgi:A/G-specific adenine glycosylase